MKYFYIDDVYFSAESISVSPVKVIHISCQLLACVCSCHTQISPQAQVQHSTADDPVTNTEDLGKHVFRH